MGEPFPEASDEAVPSLRGYNFAHVGISFAIVAVLGLSDRFSGIAAAWMIAALFLYLLVPGPAAACWAGYRFAKVHGAIPAAPVARRFGWHAGNLVAVLCLFFAMVTVIYAPLSIVDPGGRLPAWGFALMGTVLFTQYAIAVSTARICLRASARLALRRATAR